MNTLKTILLEQSDIIRPYYSVHKETSQKINTLLGEMLGKTDFTLMNTDEALEAWIINVLKENRNFELYGKIVMHFKLFRDPKITEYLFPHFFSADTYTLDFTSLLPFLHVISKHHKQARVRQSKTSDNKPHLFGQKQAQANILIRVLDLLESLQKNNQLRSPSEIAGKFSPFCGRADYLWISLLREAKHFQNNISRMFSWLEFIHEAESYAITGMHQYARMELLSLRLVGESRKIIQQYPEHTGQLSEDIKYIIRNQGTLIAAGYLRHFRLAMRARVFAEYRSVSLCLASHSHYMSRQWFRTVKKMIRLNVSLTELEKRVLGQYEKHNTVIKHLFRPVSEMKQKESAKYLDTWQNQAEYLFENVHSFAASQWMRYVVRLHEKFGRAFVQRWYERGVKLSQEIHADVSALFFYQAEHVLALEKPPDKTTFDRLLQLCQISSRNVDWFRSDLWLCHPHRKHLGFSEQWWSICTNLNQKYPCEPYAAGYRLWDKSAKELEKELTLWEKFIRTGYKSFLTRSYQKELPVNTYPLLAHEKVPVKHAFWIKLLMTLFPKLRLPLDNPPELNHPLLEKIDTESVLHECSLVLNEPVRQKIINQDALEDARYRPNIRELCYLLDNMPPEQFQFKRMHNEFFSAFKFRRKLYPQLNRLLEEVNSLSDDFHSFDKIVFLLNHQDSLLEIMPDNTRTASCTDGPDGKYAFAGVIHAMHKQAFKVLICTSCSEHEPAKYLPFASIPGFRIQADGRWCMFIDSIDIGGKIYRIENGFEIIAKEIVEFFTEIAEKYDMQLLFNTKFFNTQGKHVLEHIRSHFRHQASETDFVIHAKDLIQNHIRHFYCECLAETSGSAGFAQSAQKCYFSQIPVVWVYR